MKTNLRNFNLLKSIILSVFILSNANAIAALTQVSAFVEAGNDCNDYFNMTESGQQVKGFDNCNIFSYNDQGEYVKISPVIGKFDVTGKDKYSYESSTYGEETSASDFTLNTTSYKDGNEMVEGEWVNTASVSSDTYPGIRFWSTKAGSGKGASGGGFNLFWMVDDSLVADGNACSAGSEFTLNCMLAAQVVTTGTWTTPSGKGLSHIIFYNSKDAVVCTNCDDVVTVPEPNMLFLFATALLGFGFQRKKLSK